MNIDLYPGNAFYLRLINPYDPIMWDFYGIAPEVDEPEEIVPPDYTIDDFLKVHAVEFLGYIEEGKTLNGLFEAFKLIATRTVSYELVGQDDELWKHLVSLYIAHHLEMAMGRMKNQADEISLSPEKPKEKKIEYKFNPTTEENFDVTKYGFAFWQVYKNYARFRHWGVYMPRGAK